MARPEFDSYFLCATPRTGSTLLCGLMESSGVAGHPASYFNRKTLDVYADEWGIVLPRDGHIDETFVRAAVEAGRTPNGVFGGRIMAESLPELIQGLSAADAVPNDVQLLGDYFGRLRFVHLRRGDAVAQAVSWARSLQTHVWHPHEIVEPGGHAPQYDEDLIARLVSRIYEFNATWTDWFATHRITPFDVTYEALAADPPGTAGAVLGHLGLEVPLDQLQIRHQRQADQLNADWITRFKAD